MADTDRSVVPNVGKLQVCTWCDTPSGRPGVTLRKVTAADRHHRLREIRLCQDCFNELKRFGRQLPFSEWRRLYVRRVFQGLAAAVLAALGEAVQLSPGHRYRTREW